MPPLPRRTGEAGEDLVEPDREGAAVLVGFLRRDRLAMTEAIEDGGAFEEAAERDLTGGERFAWKEEAGGLILRRNSPKGAFRASRPSRRRALPPLPG